MFQIDKSSLPFVQTRQALLILDLQNDFVSTDSRIPVTQPTSFIDDIVKIVPDFRTTGLVIWVRSVFKASRPVNGEGDGSEQVVTDKEISTAAYARATAIGSSTRRSSGSVEGRHDRHGAIRKRMADLAKLMEPDSDEDTEVVSDETFLTVATGEKPGFVLLGTPGVELCAEVLKVRDTGKDITLDKSHYSAFKDGTLVQLLRSRFVTEIYICGALSNMSVYATAMDATQFGYAITLIDDCLGYRSQERHKETMRRLELSTGCDNIISDELLKDIRQKSQQPQPKISFPTPPKRREPPKPKENTAKAPELDSMLSKLSIDAGNATDSVIAKDAIPHRELRNAPSLVAEAEKDGSFESTSTDSQDIQALKVLSRRTGSGDAPEKPNRVQSKVRTRKKIAKRPAVEPEASTTSTSTSNNDTADPNLIASQPNTSNLEPPKEKLQATLAEPSSARMDVKRTLKTTSHKDKDSSKAVQMDSTADTRPPSKPICEGDTTIIPDLLPPELADNIFERIRDEVRWQKMSHQGGDVPRLVAVQGRVDDDGSIPIYRHPADESPPLLPFSPTVSLIREHAEKELGHPLNHVLIQFYRDGTDYISEHSDKTLDIVPNTYIVNISLGAQRTMIFRTKKQQAKGDKSESAVPEPSAARQAVRAPMPHNSMCKVGLVTNMRWLHGIRQDKRLSSEKSNAELAYSGARISLTFRQIGTFLSKDQHKIWGQGAVSKTKEKANFVINGNTHEAEKMIRAFGQENHSTEFDWASHYGAGFDVLHLNNSPKLFLSGDSITDLSVKLALGSLGIKWEEGKLSSSFKWKDGSLQPDAPEIPKELPVKFVDNDLSKSTTTGNLAVLLYLNAVYGPQLRPQVELSRLFSRLQVAEQLGQKIYASGESVNVTDFKSELELLESFAVEADFIAGKEPSIADWALFPALDTIYKKDKQAFDQGLEALKDYVVRLRAREDVVEVLGPLQEESQQNSGKALREEPQPVKEAGKKIEADQTRSDDADDDDNDDREDDD